MRQPLFATLTSSRRGTMVLMAAAMFALGVIVDTAVRSSPRGGEVASAATQQSGVLPAAPAPRSAELGVLYPAEVIRIIDGDTFEARVRVWPGLDVDTKVRLRGIDAAELHARCSGELAQAQSARTALEMILAEGGVSVSQIGIDKYGGRVDAAVATRNTADVSAALLNGGFARAYGGGKRGSWCG
jgi:endonuclease YncB( thermonuclease family)